MAKKHNLLIPYRELSKTEKEKDGISNAFLEELIVDLIEKEL